MKLFCECNSEWDDMGQVGLSCRLNCLGLPLCDGCCLYPWHDADYENMMFDLREMNS